MIVENDANVAISDSFAF